MRRSAVIGILAVLFILSLIAIVWLFMDSPYPAPGQASPQQPAWQPGKGGLLAANRPEPDRFALESVNPLVLAYPLEVLNGSTQKTIYTIVGKDVDEEGRAATWIYGVRHARGASFMVFNEYGWRLLPARDTFSGINIDPGSLVNVSAIFHENPGMFAAEGITERQVEISENMVRLTVREGTDLQKIYAFDAMTGAAAYP